MKMKIITINLPDRYYDDINILKEIGFYPSLSEFVRQAIHDLLAKDLEFNDDCKPKKFKELLEKELEAFK